MARLWEFQLPTQIQFGRGGLKKVGDCVRQFGQKVLLVGYADQAGLETAYINAAQALTRAGVSVSEFFHVPPDPEAGIAADGAQIAVDAGCNCIVGLGGGSVIDAAKGIATLAKLGGTIWDYTTANAEHRPVTDALPVVAIPTTAGTGTEVTPVAVFTHHGVGSVTGVPLKASFSSPFIRPKVALIDPNLAVGSPASLTASCGIDALGHALEAYVSRRANPVASTLAARAIRLISKNLPTAVAEPDNPEPREPMALAAMLAGAAFGSAGVVMTHAIAQALGAVLHIPHGQAVAIGTPYSLKYNAEACVDTHGQLAHYCGIRGESNEERADKFIDHVSDLLERVGLSAHVDVSADEREELADRLTINAFESTRVPITLNPRKIDETVLKQIFLEILVPAGNS